VTRALTRTRQGPFGPQEDGAATDFAGNGVIDTPYSSAMPRSVQRLPAASSPCIFLCAAREKKHGMGIGAGSGRGSRSTLPL